MNSEPRICVFGAGSIGCYVGGRLLAAGARVGFVGRTHTLAPVRSKGLQLSDLHGGHWQIDAQRFDYLSEDPAAAASSDLVLVSVKSAATETAALQLASVVRPGTVVLSLQNGLGNADVLQHLLPHCAVVAGMVPFNVIDRGDGAFHQGSSGALAAQAHAALQPILPVFARAGLPISQHIDMPAVQWGKLLLNLNNPINALSGLPLKAELSQRAYRRCLALAQRETLAVMDRASIRPAKLTPLPTHWLPSMLELPDFIFRRAANSMLAIDPLARSSMQDDLERGRRTEIDWLNGEVVQLAKKAGVNAPVNARLIELIRDAERNGRRDWSGDALLQALKLAQTAPLDSQ